MAKDNFFDDNESIGHLLGPRRTSELFKLLSEDEKAHLGVTTSEEFADLLRQILSQLGEIAGGLLNKNRRAVDGSHFTLSAGVPVAPPHLLENIKALREAGYPGLSVGKEFGGLNLPPSVELSAIDLMYRACPSTVLNVVWWGSIANIISLFGTQEQKDAWIPKIASGEISGSMGLTEPDAGSDLSAVKTYGEKQADGTYRIHGSKQFISNGDGAVCLLLAKKSKDAKGLSGLNLYLVPRLKEDGSFNFTVTKIEEKMALHGSATCALNFDGSYGELLGEEGQGFHHMLELMNEARVAVASQAAGLMEASLRMTRQYASERRAFGGSLLDLPKVKDEIEGMDLELRIFRSLLYRAFHSFSVLSKIKSDEKLGIVHEGYSKEVLHKMHDEFLRWTPILKYWGGERAVQFALKNIHVHGGYGFTTEYEPERLLREAMILPVYEGVSEVQALMLFKNEMKAVQKNLFGTFKEAITTGLLNSDPLTNAERILARTKLAVALKMSKLSAEGRLKLASRISHHYMEIAGRIEMAKSMEADERELGIDGAQKDAERFVRNELPEIQKHSRLIKDALRF